MYVMVWKSNDRYPVTSAAYSTRSELVVDLMETKVEDMPDAVLYWDEETSYSVHNWKEFAH